MNGSEVLQQLRAKASKNPRPRDWSPVLDQIMEVLGIRLVWCPVRTVKADKGTSGIQMFYEDRTIFISPRCPRHYLPEWHEVCHAVISRENLDAPNFGLEGADLELSDAAEDDTQALQIYLMERYLGNERKVRRAARSFNVDYEEATLRGRELAAERLPELPELVL